MVRELLILHKITNEWYGVYSNTPFKDTSVLCSSVDYTDLVCIGDDTWFNVKLLNGYEDDEVIFKYKDELIYVYGFKYENEIADLLMQKELLNE